MKTRGRGLLLAVAASIVPLSMYGGLSASPALPGQAPLAGQTGQIPRSPDGRPNLQGLYRTALAAEGDQAPPAGRAAGAGGGRGGAGGAGGARGRMPEIPYLPAALPVKQILAAQPWTDRSARCMPNMPRDLYSPPYPQQILQDGNNVVIVYEYGGFRIIAVDGSRHPDPATYRSPFGDSRGRWEGDTLVVDTANFPYELMHQSFTGDFTDVNLHLVERYTMLDANTLRNELTIEDPTVFSKPWTIRVNLRREPANESIMEHACREGERAVELMKPVVGGK